MLGRLYPDPDTEDELAELARIMRAIRNNNPGLLEEMRPSQNQRKRFGEAGNHLPRDANALSCKGPLLNSSIQIFGAKLGLALQYATTGRIIPPKGGIAVRWYSNFEALTGELPVDMLNILGPPQTLRQGKWHAADQFEYAYAHAEDAEMAVYFSTFRRSFAVASFVTDDISRFGGLKDVQFHRPWPCRPTEGHG